MYFLQMKTTFAQNSDGVSFARTAWQLDVPPTLPLGVRRFGWNWVWKKGSGSSDAIDNAHIGQLILTFNSDQDHGDPSSLEQTFRQPLFITHDLQAQLKHQSKALTDITTLISSELGFDAYFSLHKINLAIFNHSFPNISSFHEKVGKLLRKIQVSDALKTGSQQDNLISYS